MGLELDGEQLLAWHNFLFGRFRSVCKAGGMRAC